MGTPQFVSLVPEGMTPATPGWYGEAIAVTQKLGQEYVKLFVNDPKMEPPPGLNPTEKAMLLRVRSGLVSKETREAKLPKFSEEPSAVAPPIHPPIPDSAREAFDLTYREIFAKGPAFAEEFQKKHPDAFEFLQRQHRDRIQPGRRLTQLPGQPANPAATPPPKNAA